MYIWVFFFKINSDLEYKSEDNFYNHIQSTKLSLISLVPILLKDHTDTLCIWGVLYIFYIFRKSVYEIFISITDKESHCSCLLWNKETKKKCTAISKPRSTVWQRKASLSFVDYLAKIFDQVVIIFKYFNLICRHRSLTIPVDPRL